VSDAGGLAVYTTVYPGSEPFWPPFLKSLAAQGDQDFTLWIGVDGLEPGSVLACVERYTGVPVRLSAGGGTPAAVRCRAFCQMMDLHEAVVLVDCDDMLLPSRVAAARAAIEEVDGAGCAQELIDVDGNRLGRIFCPAVPEHAPALLPCANVFGFSNTVYRTATLRRCLPVSDASDLMDWQVATKAWLLGARLGFDATPRMLYRQHPKNAAGVLGPFTPDRLRADIPRVLRHYRFVLESDRDDAIPDRWQAVVDVEARLAGYWAAVQDRPELVDGYESSRDANTSVPMWWEWVTAAVCDC
jgi:hypothetical protein